MSQNDRLLFWLQRHPEGITDLVSLRDLGIRRLAARVWELRQAGNDIRSETVITSNGARISRYWLFQEPVQLAVGL